MSHQRVVLVCLPSGTKFYDPGPEETKKRNAQLVDAWSDDVTSIVGTASGGFDALRRCAMSPSVERLVILSTPFDQDALAEIDIDAIAAKTLLLFGQADPETGHKHGSSWQRRLPNARLEMVPRADANLLVPMWHRVLRHVAPSR